MRLAAVSFLVTLCILVAVADLGRLPDAVLAVYALPWGDKLGHITVALVGAFLCDGALGGKRLGAVPLGSALLALALTAEELSQVASPHRVMDPVDLLATLVGVALGAWLQSSCSSERSDVPSSLAS